MNVLLRDQRSKCLRNARVVDSFKVSVSFFKESEKWRSVFSSVHHGLFISSSLVFDFLNVLVSNRVDSSS